MRLVERDIDDQWVSKKMIITARRRQGIKVGEGANQDAASARGRLVAPGMLLGLGFGGFIDGIVFHQLLQWHHLLSNTSDNPVMTLEGLEANTLADGVFHAATWALALIGVLVLWKVVRHHEVRSHGRCLVGWMLAGWGIFNLIEGIVNHHLLEIHHVRDDVANPAPWDLGFLASGLLLLVIGMALIRAKDRATSAQ